MKSKTTIFLLFCLVSISIFGQKTNEKGERLIKRIKVTYSYSDKDDFALNFSYGDDNEINKLIHDFVGVRDQYTISYNDYGLKEVKYACFKIYRKDGKKWKSITNKEKHYSFNKRGTLFKKFVYFNTIKQRIIYSFFYSKQKLHKMEEEISDNCESKNNYFGVSKFVWEDNNLISYNVEKDIKNEHEFGYKMSEHYIYSSVNNNTNIDLNYLLINGDHRLNAIEGVLGFFGDKSKKLLSFENKRNAMNNGHYEYSSDNNSNVIKIVYKIKEGTYLKFPEEEGKKWKWNDYMTIVIEYVK